jgi:ribosomal protein L36
MLEADHPPPSSAELIYASTSHKSSWRGAYILKRKGNFTVVCNSESRKERTDVVKFQLFDEACFEVCILLMNKEWALKGTLLKE